MENIILLKYPKNWGLSENQVLAAAREALKVKGFKQNTELSIVFVGRKRAKALNVKYRQKSYIPQVLGFPLSRVPDADGTIRLGDIVICSQKVKYEAKFQKKPVEVILNEWVLHGVEDLLI